MANSVLINGTFYSAETPGNLIKVLELLVATQERVNLEFGNIATGQVWPDGKQVGYISRSYPEGYGLILLKAKNSRKGEIIVTEHIIKITAKGGRIVYQGPIN
jgi:hypothetical protein